MKVFLIRHGESTGDIEDRYGGDYDDHLTAHGKEQAEMLAMEICEEGIENIYTSSRIRAKETANIIARGLKLPIYEVDDIRERNNYGILTGMVKSKAKEIYPDEVSKLSRYDHDIKSSESYDKFKKRVIESFDRICKKESEGSHGYAIAIVTHGGPISCILREKGLGEIETLGDCACIEMDCGVSLSILSLHHATLHEGN